ALARHVSYTFQLFDDQNLLVAERAGSVDLPPIQTIPIIEPNIAVGNRVVTRTLFSFADQPIVWSHVLQSAYPTLAVGQQSHNDDYSRLEATLSNPTLTTA